MLVSELDATIMPISTALISSNVSKAMIRATPRSDDLDFVLWCLIMNVLLAGRLLVCGGHRTIVQGDFSLERSLNHLVCLDIPDYGVADQQADLDRFDGGESLGARQGADVQRQGRRRNLSSVTLEIAEDDRVQRVIDFGSPVWWDGQWITGNFVDLAALEAERAIAVTVDFVLHALHVAIPVGIRLELDRGVVYFHQADRHPVVIGIGVVPGVSRRR